MKTTYRELAKNGWVHHDDGEDTEYTITYSIIPDKPFVYSIVKNVKYTKNNTYKRRKSFFRKEYKDFSVDSEFRLYLRSFSEYGDTWSNGGEELLFNSIEEAEEYLEKHLQYEKEAKEFMSQKPVEVKI